MAESGHLRPLAGSGHLRPLAGSGHLRPLAATRLERPLAWSGHLRPLAWSGHLQPLAATRVAASGCEWLRAGRNTWQSWHLEKNRFCWKGVFFSQVWRLDRQDFIVPHETMWLTICHPCRPQRGEDLGAQHQRWQNGRKLKRRSWRIAPMMVQCWKVEGIERSKMTVECWKWKRYPRAQHQ